ncbi:MAG: DUF6785 family protein [Candidatus Latescibacterota bacterium]
MTDRVAPGNPTQSVFTFRSIFLGLTMVLVVCLGAPVSIWMVGSTEITWSFFPIGVGLPFVLLVLGNAAVKRLRRPLALTPPEMVTVVIMGLVASGIPIFMVGLLLSIPSKPYYGATPENDWAGSIQPFLPDWAIPSPQGGAMRYFYEGLPQGAAIPWDAWLGPLAWWLSLILAIYFLCFCVVVILRRQWMEHERLVFPVTEVPRLLTEDDGTALPPVLRSRTFWIGCAVPLVIILFNCISYWQPGFPQIQIHTDYPVELFRGAPTLLLKIYFPIIGFVYLISTPISFSVWFFYLLSLAGTALVNWLGMTVQPDSFMYSPHTQLQWTSSGAFVAMVFWSLWMGRYHLAAVYRTVVRRTGELDDVDEMIPYPLAVWGGLAVTVFIVGWLWASGMDLHVAMLLLLLVMVVYIGMTRIVVQSGVVYVTAPFSPQALTLAVTGTAIAPQNLVALSLSYSWCSDIQSIFMPAAAHGARLNVLGGERRRLGWAIGLAAIFGFVVTIWFLMVLCYEYGAGNFRSWFFDPGAGAGGLAFDQAARLMGDPHGPDGDKLGLFTFGAVLYSVLSLFQYRFHWWPLHPVGLTIATLWNLRLIATSVFIAWALKSAVLRVGGITAYRQMRPFFIGLIVGFFLGVGAAYAIDAVWFFGKGHAILHG